MKIPLLDLGAQYATIREEIEAAVSGVLESQQFVLGSVVESFETEMASYTGVSHAVGCASGSDALLLSLMALGIGPSDAVVTSPFTFFATASAITRLGARAVFADVDPETLNVTPSSLATAMDGVRADVDRWTILPVHLFGRLADMEGILAMAREREATVVEDAAQAVGARDKGGRQAGTLGDTGTLSFFPSKNLGGAGDGGMVLAGDDDLADRVRMLRVHGSREQCFHEVVGINSRLDAIQAAILSVKLRRLDEWNASRRRVAESYGEAFREAGLAPGTVAMPAAGDAGHVYHQYVIRVSRRDALREALDATGISTQVYYPLSLHEQECFRFLGYRTGDFPEAERAAAEVLALPIYPELREDKILAVVAAIADFYRM